MAAPLTGSERILLIDTCGETAGVALVMGPEVLAAEDLPQGSASASIVPALRRLLVAAGWQLQDLDAIGVVSGPGSFTGIRAGLSVAKGLGEATQVKLATVSRLEVLADAAGLSEGFAVLDAGRKEAYVRAIRTGREWLSPLDDVAANCLGQKVAVAEARLADRLVECTLALVPLHASHALHAVLRQLRLGGSNVEHADANYVRAEQDIYRNPVQGSQADRGSS